MGGLILNSHPKTDSKQISFEKKYPKDPWPLLFKIVDTALDLQFVAIVKFGSCLYLLSNFD